MSAMFGFHKVNKGVGENSNARLRSQANEWVVEREENQCGNRDTIYNSGGRGTVIVVVSVLEATVTGNDLVIEVPQRANGPMAVLVIDIWKQRGFTAIAAHEAAKEMPFVKPVDGFVESVRTGRKIDRGANRRNLA